VARIPHATCEYTTAFDSTVSTAVGPMTVDLVWLVNGSPAQHDKIVFAATGTQSANVSISVRVPPLGFLERWPVALHVTAAAGVDFVTRAGTASCDQVAHT
jgi:hypothetical protein